MNSRKYTIKYTPRNQATVYNTPNMHISHVSHAGIFVIFDTIEDKLAFILKHGDIEKEWINE